MKKQSGFTLIELMLVLAIMSIIISVGVPGMRTYLSNSAADSLSNAILIDIMYARNHAITNATTVKMIPIGTANTGVSTFLPDTEGVNWGQGWTIFEDTDNDNNVDNTELVIRTQASLGTDAHISSGPGGHIASGPVGILDNSRPIGFNNDGTAINSGVLSIATWGCAGNHGHIIQINQIGQVIGRDTDCPIEFTNL